MVESTAATRPGRWLVIGIGLVPAILAILGVGLWLWALIASRTLTEHATFPQPAGHIEIDAGAGDVTIVASDDGQMSVQRRITWTVARPEVTQTWESGKLRLAAHCSGLSLVNRCHASYVLRIPDPVGVTVRTSAGDVVVRDTTGPLRVHTDTGNVTVHGVAGDAEIASGTGDVRLSYASAPRSVKATSRTGDVSIAVPAGTPYELRVSGDEPALGFASVAGASNVIESRSGTGAIVVSHTGS